MQTAFRKIFWGLVIVAVDINIDELDLLLPDIVGYVLVYLALTDLAKVNEQFAKARPYTVGAAIVWVVSMLRVVPVSITGITTVLLDLIVTWYICTGIMQLAIAQSNLDLAREAVTRRTWFVGVSVTNIFVAAVALLAPDLVRLIMIPLVIIALTIWLLVLLLIRRASAEIL